MQLFLFLITMSYQIELRHLRYFSTLVEHLNFHRAAEELHISQPGLSRQIAQLEFHLGTQLFVRNRRRVSLTMAGKYLSEQLVPQLNNLNRIYQQTQRIGSGSVGEIRIGFLGSAMQQVIPDLLLSLKTSYPDLYTSLTERSNLEQIQELMESRLDLAFVRLTDLPAELESCTVAQETFSLVVPAGHTATSCNLTSLAPLANDGFILFNSDYSPDYYRTVLSICEDAGFHPRISHKSVHAHTIFRLVEAGLGVSIVPTSLQKGFQMNIRFIALENIRQRAVLKAVWKRDHHNRALDTCIEHLRNQSLGL
jgi:DNA-binding transcriptional LysR family regulator